MTSRERICETIKNRALADKIPWTFNFGATQGFNPCLLYKYKKEMSIEGPTRDYFDYDIFTVLDPEVTRLSEGKGAGEKTGLEALVGGLKLSPNNIEPLEFYSEIPEGSYIDAWGVLHTPWPIDRTFEVLTPPLANAKSLVEIESYPSPKVDPQSLAEASDDVKHIKESQKISVCYAGSVYEWSWYLVGQEKFLTDIYDNPRLIGVLVDKVAEFTRTLALLLQEIGVDILAF